MLPRIYAASLFLLALAASAVSAQDFFLPDDDAFTEVIAALKADDNDRAQQELDKLSNSHATSGDYHYIQGTLTMAELQEAGRLRMPFIARRMRGHFEEAVKYDPEHELAHFALFQWHQFAPGIIGGDKEVMQAHKARLDELDSFLRFPARISMTEDLEAEEAIYQEWFATEPENLDIRFNYIALRISQQHFELALSELQHTRTLLTDSEAHQELRNALDYQWARLAAESQTELDNGYFLLTQLIAEQRTPEGIDQDWVQFRLAQIYTHKEEYEQARELLEQLDGTSDKRLETALKTFNEEHLKNCCS
ncbi:hypothetical protein CWE09_04095 [Aliidiomarina minuta]|uniref:Uncharacterized protein n=2 Tax=Aliidiomarina minuta TaxID=880057 RepID=A0A432W7I7_9GAMM|nr:hypothetical protein CWE09_04095 [Aliidiomarina minuta]